MKRRTKEEEKFLRILGENLRELRKKANYSSQDKFAYDSEIPRAQYARYEKGTNITILSLKKVLKFHKIELSDFFRNME